MRVKDGVRCGRKRENLVDFVIFEKKKKTILIESCEIWKLVKVKNKLGSLFLISN